MDVKPINGVNLRQDGYDMDKSQWMSMQNADYTHKEMFEQIPGSVRFHGTSLGTGNPSAIMVCYNDDENRGDILVAVDDQIFRKTEGENEFASLIGGLPSNGIKFSVNLNNKQYIPHKDVGLYEYDGIQTIEKINDVKLVDMIYSRETDRFFGISSEDQKQLFWTDGLTHKDNNGAPLTWPGVNVMVFPPTGGDVIERLHFFRGRLVLFMNNSIWLMYVNGGPSNWRPEKTPTAVGIIAPKTLQQVGTELWFLGYSPKTGRGIYAFDGVTSRLLSYDVEPYIDRANDDRIYEACAEYVNNIYKISLPIDGATENNRTLHLDPINTNRLTESPNVYGPHTYGFNCSTTLNTKRFRGQHLFGKVRSSEARIYRVHEEYQTQYSSELDDDGDLIPVELLTGVLTDVQVEKVIYDSTWLKRYGKIFLYHPPLGSYSAKIEIFKDDENDLISDYLAYLEGHTDTIESLILGTTPLERNSEVDNIHLEHILAYAIQFRISSEQVNQKVAFKSLQYDAIPVRRKKVVQNVQI